MRWSSKIHTWYGFLHFFVNFFFLVQTILCIDNAIDDTTTISFIEKKLDSYLKTKFFIKDVLAIESTTRLSDSLLIATHKMEKVCHNLQIEEFVHQPIDVVLWHARWYQYKIENVCHNLFFLIKKTFFYFHVSNCRNCCWKLFFKWNGSEKYIFSRFY